MIAIERRAFPTPWSLAMFVLELSKPSGICLAAIGRDRRLVGYLICARYDEAWHLMNIAVDPDRAGAGIAGALLEEMIERAGADRRQLHARGPDLERAARSRCTSATAFAASARAGATTRTPARTR